MITKSEIQAVLDKAEWFSQYFWGKVDVNGHMQM